MRGRPADQAGATPLRRHWRLVVVGLLIGLAGGFTAAALGPKVYVSSTSMLVLPVPAQTLGGQVANAEIDLGTEAELARSGQTADTAASAALRDSPSGQLTDAVTVSVVANSSVLVLRFEAGTPAAAQAGARAFARAYLANRAQVATKVLADQSAALIRKLKLSTAQLASVNAAIAKLKSNSPQLDTLRANRQTLTTEISTLSARATDVATTTVTAGRIIRDADLPTEPASPSAPLNLAGGGLAGLALGFVAVVTRERLARRVHSGADVARHADLPLLAELTGDLPGIRTLAPRVFAPQHAPGRAFHRLRNEVVAALAATDRVILVTGASPGRASTVVAANLAAALARADNEVVLVGANVPELGSDGLLLSHVFDVADVPGLTDVLTRRAPLTSALQRAPRAPRLRVVAPGGTASAAGLLQSEAVRVTIDALRELARYVIVEAPSAASGADAQSLAGLADAAIVVVETGRARHDQVADAALQLKVVGTRILGAVVLPPLAAEDADSDDDDDVVPPAHRAADAGLRATDTWINPATMNAPTALHPTLPLASHAARPGPDQPANAMPGESTPNEATSGRARSGNETSGNETSGNETSGNATLGGRIPSEPTPGGATPGGATPGGATPGGAARREGPRREAKPTVAQPGAARPASAKSAGRRRRP